MPMTNNELILLAAADATSPGQTIPLETLVVLAWHRHPMIFGLPGYKKDYPDSRKVTAYLYKASGRWGIVHGYRWLEKTGPNLYRVTEAGRQRVTQLKALKENDS